MFLRTPPFLADAKKGRYEKEAQRYECTASRTMISVLSLCLMIYGIMLLLAQGPLLSRHMAGFFTICLFCVASLLLCFWIGREMKTHLKRASHRGIQFSAVLTTFTFALLLFFDSVTLTAFFMAIIGSSVSCLHPRRYLLYLTFSTCLSGGVYWFIHWKSQEPMDAHFFIDNLLVAFCALALNLLRTLDQYSIFAMQAQLENERDTDSLTGLINRSALNRCFTAQRNSRELLALIMLDLDRFKQVNDRFGHQLGDQVLIQISEILRSTFRRDDCVARVGGDEFLILLPLNTADLHVVKERVQFLLDQTPIRVGESENQVNVTFSIGAYVCPSTQVTSLDAITAAADQIMYRAKERRDNAFLLFPGQEEPLLLSPSSQRKGCSIPAAPL